MDPRPGASPRTRLTRVQEAHHSLTLLFGVCQLYRCLKWKIVPAKPLAPELSMWYASVIKTFALGMMYGPMSPCGELPRPS